MIKSYFEDLHNSIWVNTYKMLPMESCGIIVNNEFRPCKNIASDPYKTFKIDRKVIVDAHVNGTLQAIVHSHINYPYLSKEDMIRSHDSGVAWGVALVDGNRKNGIYFWGGDIETQEFKDRPFVYGVYDCYSLVRDYYLVKMGEKLPPVFSDYLWWEKGETLFEDLFEDFGFRRVDSKDYTKGDIFMWAIGSHVVNHIGVYGGNDTILHHLNGRLSGFTDVKTWGRAAKYVLRSKSKC